MDGRARQPGLGKRGAPRWLGHVHLAGPDGLRPAACGLGRHRSRRTTPNAPARRATPTSGSSDRRHRPRRRAPTRSATCRSSRPPTAGDRSSATPATASRPPATATRSPSTASPTPRASAPTRSATSRSTSAATAPGSPPRSASTTRRTGRARSPSAWSPTARPWLTTPTIRGHQPADVARRRRHRRAGPRPGRRRRRRRQRQRPRRLGNTDPHLHVTDSRIQCANRSHHAPVMPPARHPRARCGGSARPRAPCPSALTDIRLARMVALSAASRPSQARLNQQMNDRSSSDMSRLPSGAPASGPSLRLQRLRSCRLASRSLPPQRRPPRSRVPHPDHRAPVTSTPPPAPCVAAHSTTRALYASYNGPLYQVMRLSDDAVKDIGVVQPHASPVPGCGRVRRRGRAGRVLREHVLRHHQDLRPVSQSQRPHPGAPRRVQRPGHGRL